MQFGIGDGFKFGCGFALAMAAAGLASIIFAVTLVLLGMLLNVQVPAWMGTLGGSP